MRRVLLAVVGSMVLVLSLAVPAAAESVTVAGAPGGYITKMTANNGQSALTTKVYGLGNKCVARFLRVDIRYGQGQKYHVEAGCTTTRTWFQYLFFKQSQVRCPKFAMTYTAATSAWRVFIPRSCLSRAPDRLKVYAEGANAAGNALPGIAGPTKSLRRG
jgi:hypothetical protein